MSTQGDLFEHQAKAQPWPSWFRPSKHQPTAARNVAMGSHPLGGELGPLGETCGGCLHLHPRGRFLKCRKTTMSSCTASDVRAKWRACFQFQSR